MLGQIARKDCRWKFFIMSVRENDNVCSYLLRGVLAPTQAFMHRYLTPCRILLVIAAVALLAERVSANPINFVKDVRPIFEKHCYSCHSASKQKSGFRLDVKSEALKGGDAYAPSIIPGKAKESPLVHFINGTESDLLMPPEGEKLTGEEIAIISRWIDEGAAWPEGVDRVSIKDRRDHWSFKPISKPIIPEVMQADWPRHALDRFILAKLEKEGLRPAREAERATWFRRVSFDLTGLPPTPEQMREFLDDRRAEAYEVAVDRLLDSPHYGERWAQHWLDVVRYADTHGFEVNTERPNAWPYRDYVIEALNRDTPYDQFIREQIIGDSLKQDAATGFLVTASVLLPGQIGADEPSKRLARQDSLDEIVVNIGQSFLGLSIGCARCHDHKFDPISQRDYYSMQAFVAGVEYADRDVYSPEAEALRRQAELLKPRLAQIEQELALLEPKAKSGVERMPVNPRQNNDRIGPVKANKVRFTINATNSLEPCIDEIEVFNSRGENIALASNGTKVRSSGDTTVADRHELRFVNDGQYGNSRSWMSNEQGRGWIELEFPREEEITRIVWGRDRLAEFSDRLAIDYLIELASDSSDWTAVADSSDRRKFDPNASASAEFSMAGLPPEEARLAMDLFAERKSIEEKVKKASAGQLAFAGKFRQPDVIRLLSRGDPEQPKDAVGPTTLALFNPKELPSDLPELDRRRALVEWIVSEGNPLTARVMANRIWQGHFGTGLVETANDFGNNGSKPTHPELLDWLANELIRVNWSLKAMHRTIVLSATYRQSTRFNREAFAKDSDDRLLWRYPLRRLDAEIIRDSMLMVAGELNPKMGGPGFDLFNQRGGLSGFSPIEVPEGEGRRRMIYAHKVRRERDAVFGAFDCPDGGQSTERRRESTTPIQALNLLNSQFTLVESAAFATRVKGEVGHLPDDQIRRCYEVALNRSPTAHELEEARPVIEKHGLETLCRVLFNSNEFLFWP
jgi:hypothetical protein